MILYINACAWHESRTKRLADHLLRIMTGTTDEMPDGKIEEVRLLDIEFPVVDFDFLERREKLLAKGDFGNPLFDFARQFAAADRIVIAAPYWDLSFPAVLKAYFEQINVVGVTFEYSATGAVTGLCKAEKLYYVTTCGGTFAPDEYGYGYVEALAKNYYEIPETKLIKATGLDIAGADTERIMQECMESVGL